MAHIFYEFFFKKKRKSAQAFPQKIYKQFCGLVIFAGNMCGGKYVLNVSSLVTKYWVL